MPQTPFHKKLKQFKINILGFPYKVKFVKDMLDKFHIAGCSGVYSGEIDLDPGVTDLDICSALMHEMIEMCFVKTETMVEHDVINKIETFVMALMIMNPELMEFLLNETKKAKPSSNRGQKKLKRVGKKNKGASRE